MMRSSKSSMLCLTIKKPVWWTTSATDGYDRGRDVDRRTDSERRTSSTTKYRYRDRRAVRQNTGIETGEQWDKIQV